MTLTEVLVVIVVLAVLLLVFLPAFISDNPRNPRYFRIQCVSNLKQIGLACRIWANDNNDKYPMQVSSTNGGAMELIAAGNVAACFQVMSNELEMPRLLICPADRNRIPATSFTNGLNNSNISYFVGLDADQKNPRVFLSGDDNFDIGGAEVKSGLLRLSTKAPITWTAARHKHAGNIGFADGSVWQMNAENLQQELQQTGVVTNRLAIP
jgi:prepilin-type processing-associated H-X9-DG protein